MFIQKKIFLLIFGETVIGIKNVHYCGVNNYTDLEL